MMQFIFSIPDLINALFITGVWYDSNIFLTAILYAFLYGRNKRVFDR